jgi:hypothetical protein
VRADPDPQDKESVEIIAAHAAARAAMVDLRLSGATSPRDYKVAEELLAVAAHLADQASANLDEARKSAGIADQQTIYRLYLEAATGADDVEAIRKIIGKLVQLDPADTVAQLRLISARISDFQTADARLAAYERFLGPDGERFDESVRSRLALDAALLLRERGDTDGFVEKLDLAMRLDKTNKDAATLGMNFFAQRLNDPKGMFEWKLSVLGADPFDPSVYSSIVDQLLNEGAFKGAFHFAQLHRKLSTVQERRLSDAEELNYDLAEWNVTGPDAVIRRISDVLEKARMQATEERKIAADRNLPVDGLPKPEELRLPFARDRMRALAAAAIGDVERAQVFLGELAETVRIRTEEAMDPARRPQGVTEEQARTVTRAAAAEVAWLRLWAGVQTAEAAASLKELSDVGALNEATKARLEAWILVRTREYVRADAALRAIAAEDPLAALGMAVLSEVQGDKSTAVVRYRDLAWHMPGTEVGAYAATKYYSIAREKPVQSELARDLEKNAAGVPKWLDAMVENPRRIMTLDAAVVQRSEISPIDRTPVRVTVRNASQIPLAMGPDQAINTRLLFAPSIEVGSARLPANDLNHVASLDRRLRLMPNESFDIITYPDMGILSHMAELALPKQARIRWRVLQGFQLVDQKMYDAGPQCLTTEIPTMMRRLPNRSDAVFGALQYALQTGGTREVADAILSIKYQLSASTTLKAEDLDKLVEVIARQFGSKLRATKIMILCLLPTQANLPQVVRIDQLLVQETDEDVLAVALATRVVKPGDPLLTAPAVVKSPQLVALAQMVQERLAAGVKTYATSSLSAPDLVGGMMPNPGPEQPKPLDLDTSKPVDPNAPATSPQRKPVDPVDPPDTAPVPVLP